MNQELRQTNYPIFRRL